MTDVIYVFFYNYVSRKEYDKTISPLNVIFIIVFNYSLVVGLLSNSEN